MVDGDGREPLTFYLDIDGVVTTVRYQQRNGKDALDPAALAIVAALVRDFGARIVVSSTWRIDDCRATLVSAGLPNSCFHPDWRTAIPASSRHPETGAMLAADQAGRGEEIAEHVRRNGIGRYLVLDDVDVGSGHAGRHVRPNASVGLTAADGMLARHIISRMETGTDQNLGEVPSDRSMNH